MMKYCCLALCLAGLFSANAPAAGKTATTSSGDWQAWFAEPTVRYGHNVLGDTPEWGQLCLRGAGSEACVTLPEHRVFEDIAPRLADVDRDGRLDAVVVESDFRLGAALAVYRLEADGSLQRIATPPIGTSYRWLAPIGIADLDANGDIEIAYIDRPHLARTLRVWRYVDGRLLEVASKPGYSNHRIGDAFIVGGLRICAGESTLMITADAFWSQIVATRFDGENLVSRDLGPLDSDADFERALQCDTGS